MLPFLQLNGIASIGSFEFESICRYYAQSLRLDGRVAVCRILSRYKIYVDVSDMSLAHHLALDGFWESWLTRFLAQQVKPGDICVDIGANFGYYSVLFSALAGDGGKTIAVEPNPAVSSLLRKTASMNSPGFVVIDKAVSNRAGKATLNVPGDYLGDANLIARPVPAGRKNESTEVETVTLDDLLAGLQVEKVDFIKIDAEGAEPFIFEGMSRTLRQNPSIRIVSEYSPGLYEDTEGFTRKLFREFNVARVTDEGPRPVPETEIGRLMDLTGHTDLFLTLKTGS